MTQGPFDPVRRTECTAYREVVQIVTFKLDHDVVCATHRAALTSPPILQNQYSTTRYD